MIKEIQREIYRAYRVLGRTAYYQNETDLTAWRTEGYITSDEYDALHQLNRTIYIKLRTESVASAARATIQCMTNDYIIK